MQSIEEFMRQYLDERITEERREQASRAPFRRKFHTDDCRWDSRAGTLEMIQSERILNVSNSGATAEVITTRDCSRLINGVHQLRYHLQRGGEGWLIQSVDLWCHACHGVRGQESCIFCHGTGWLDRKKSEASLLKRDVPPSSRL